MVATSHLEESPLLIDLLIHGAQELLPTWRPQLEELRELGRTNLVELLKLGVRQELFRADLDIDLVAGLLQDFHLATYIMRAHDNPGERLLDRARAGMDLILNGLRVRPPPATI